MAIIKCPNCGEYISDKATQCIHCSFEFDNQLQPQAESSMQLTDDALQSPNINRTFNAKKTLILVFSALFSLVVVIGIIIFIKKPSNNSGNIKKGTKYYSFEDPKVYTGIETYTVEGTKEAFNRIDEEDKKMLRNYMDSWHTLIDRTANHERKVLEEKDSNIKYFSDNLDSILAKYKNSKEEYTVMMDFLKLLAFDANYTVKGFNCNLYIDLNGNEKNKDTFIYDEKYDQYLYDISTYVNEIERTYYS